MTHITFIGFSIVASHFAEALSKNGAQVAAYDILLETPDGLATLQRRTRNTSVTFGSLSGVIPQANYILSTVTSHGAESAAAACVPHLKPGQAYVDLNSTAPETKRAVADRIAPSGADFVEGAILGAVPVTGANTRILIGGPKGQSAADAFANLGLHTDFYHPEIGKASTFKILRSIFSKGMETLLLEFLTAGKRAGIQKDLWQDIVDLFTHNAFEDVAANWICTHAVAHQRRHHEMGEVTTVMRNLDLDPIISASTEAFFQRANTFGFQAAFSESPTDMQAVIDFMEQQLKEPGKP